MVDGSYSSNGATHSTSGAAPQSITGQPQQQRRVANQVDAQQRNQPVEASSKHITLLNEIGAFIMQEDREKAMVLLNNPKNKQLLERHGYAYADIAAYIDQYVLYYGIYNSIQHKLRLGDEKSAYEILESTDTKRTLSIAFGKDVANKLTELREMIAAESAALKIERIISALVLDFGQPEKALELLDKPETLRAFSLSKKVKPQERIEELRQAVIENAAASKKSYELRMMAAEGAEGLKRALDLLEHDRDTRVTMSGYDIEAFKEKLRAQAAKSDAIGEIPELIDEGRFEEALRQLSERGDDLKEAGVEVGSLASQIRNDSLLGLAIMLIVERGSRDEKAYESGKSLLPSLGDYLEENGISAEKLFAGLEVLRVVEQFKNSGDYAGAIEYLSENDKRNLRAINDSGKFDGSKILAELEKKAEAVRSGLGNLTFKISFADPVSGSDARIENVAILDENGQAVRSGAFFEYEMSDGVKKRISLMEISNMLSLVVRPEGTSRYLVVPPSQAISDPKILATALYSFVMDQKPKVSPTAEREASNIISTYTEDGRACFDVQINIDEEMVSQLQKKAERDSEITGPMEASYSGARIYLPDGVVEDAHYVGAIDDPQKFAGEHPFAAFKMSLWQRIVPGTAHPSIPQAVTDSISPDDLRVLASQLLPSSESNRKYFHRPLNEEERAKVRELRSDFENGTAEYRVLSEILKISELDVKINGNIRVSLGSDELVEALDRLAKNNPLVAEFRDSYYSDGEYSPIEASIISELADWMEENHIEKLTPFQDIRGSRSQDEAYVDGLNVLANHVYAGLIGFDPRKAEQYVQNAASRIAGSVMDTASMVLSQGARPTMVTMGISGAENWKIALLKKQFWGEQKWAEFLSLQTELEAMLQTTIDRAEAIKSDTGLTQEQQIEQLEPLVREYSHLKGRLDTLFDQMFSIDQKFFDWFVENYANETMADKLKDFLLEPLNESQFGSSVIDPFTKEPIKLSHLPEILNLARQNADIRDDLARGWLSLDPSRGSEDTRRAKMAMALMITYLDIEEGTLEKANPNAAYAKMATNQMFFASAPVHHLGAAIKGYLMFQLRDDPVKKGVLARGLENPDDFDKQTLGVLMDVIKMASPEAESDSQYLLLKAIYDGMSEDEIVTVRSDMFADPKAQEIMQGYYYLGKLLSKNGGLEIIDEAGGEGTWLESMYGAANFVMGGMLDQVQNSRYDRPERPLTDNWYRTRVGEMMGSDSIPVNIAAAIPSAAVEFGGTLVRFGPWMGLHFGWSLPFSLAKSATWDVVTGKTTMAVNQTNGLPIEDEAGRLVFNTASLEDVGSNLLNLVTQIWLFRNDPFLLYGWLGVGEDIEENQWLSAFIKVWASNFYLMMPGKNGFWDSTWGRGMSIDRYAWKLARMAWDLKQNMSDLVSRHGVDAVQLEAQLKEAGLDKVIAETQKYSSFSDFARSFVETASRKGALGAFTEKIGETDVMHRFMSGSLGKAKERWPGKFAAGMLSPNPMFSAIQRKAQSSSAYHAMENAVKITFKVPFQTLNLMHHEARAVVRGARALGFDRISSGALLREVDPASEQKVINVSELGRVEPPKSQDFDERINYEVYRLAYDDNGQQRQVSLNIKTGENMVETVKLPVGRIIIDSSTALMSETPVTILPSGSKGVSLGAASEAEIHINSTLMGMACLDPSDEPGRIAEQALEMARTQTIDNPDYYRAPQVLTWAEFSKMLGDNGISLQDKVPDGETPLSRQAAVDLIADLKKSGRTSISARDLGDNIRAAVSESYRTSHPDLSISDRMTFELCGNIADGNKRAGLLRAGEHVDNNFKLTPEGRAFIRSYITSQFPDVDSALIAQVAGKTELYLESQDFARRVIAENGNMKGMDDKALQAEAEGLLNKSDLTAQDRVRAAALVMEATYRETGNKVKLTAGQIMSGYMGAKATNDTPVNINFETGEGKTYTQALDSFLRLMERGKRVILNTSTCDPFAKDNYDDLSGVLRRLGVGSEILYDSSSDSSIRTALADRGQKRVVFGNFDTPRFAQLFTVNPQGGGVPVFVPNDRYMGLIIDEGDYSIWDLRNNPAIVSTGGDAKAADADKVLQAEEIVRGWFSGSELKPECARYVDNADSREHIVLSKDGIVEIRRLAGNSFNAEELTPYIKNALFVHSFMREGIDFKQKGAFVFLRRYMLRDPSTGRDRPGMQLDLEQHKAVQAMIGIKKITDPGVPPVSITVPEFLRGIGYSSYSGTWSPLEAVMAREGVLTFSTESSFSRTRVDHNGIVFGDKSVQLDAVANRAMADAARPGGGACLIHAAARTRAEGSGVLSIEEIFNKLNESYRSQEYTVKPDGNGAFTATKPGEEPIRVMILVDEGDLAREKNKSKKIGDARTITLTDIASRAMNPGIQDAIDKATGEASGKVYLNTIVTAWDKSVRDYLQRIARAGRPVGGKERVPASSVAYFNAEDKGFSPEMRAYLNWAIGQNGGKPIVAIPADFPMLSTTYNIGTLESDAVRIVEDLRVAGVIDQGKADTTKQAIAGILAEGIPEADKRLRIISLLHSIDEANHSIVSRYWRFSEQKLIDEIRNADLMRSESFEAKYAATLRALSAIADGSADAETIRGLFEAPLKETIDMIMDENKVSDANSRGEWNLKGLTDALAKIGITVEIDPQVRSAEEIRAQLGSYIGTILSNPKVDPLQRQRLVDFLKDQIGSLKLEYEALKRQTADRQDSSFIWKVLDMEYSKRMSWVIASGKQGWGFKRQTVLDRITGLPRSGLTFRMPSIRALNPVTFLGAASDRVKVSPALVGDGTAPAEREVESRIRAIVRNNGHVGNNAIASKVTINGTEYALTTQDGIKALNAELARIGSDKRVYFNPHSREYIYGSVDPAIINVGDSERQIIFLTEEVISPGIRDWAVAFIPRAKVDLFGNEPKHETIIRNKAIEDAYDRMADSAFKPHGHLLPGHAFAREMFRVNNISDSGSAANASDDQKSVIVSAMRQAVSSHESGHAVIFEQYSTLNVRYVHPLPNEMIELLADTRILIDIANESGQWASKEQQTRMLSHLYYLSNKSGEISQEVSRILERCLDERGGIDFQKLGLAADRLTTLLTEKIQQADRLISGGQQDPQRLADELRQIGRDLVRELGVLKGTVGGDIPDSARPASVDDQKQVRTGSIDDALAEYRQASSGGRPLSQEALENIARNNGLTPEETAQFRAQIDTGQVNSGGQSGSITESQASALQNAKPVGAPKVQEMARSIVAGLISPDARFVDPDTAGKIGSVTVIPDADFDRINVDGDAAFVKGADGRYSIFVRRSAINMGVSGDLTPASAGRIARAVTHELAEIYMLEKNPEMPAAERSVAAHFAGQMVEREVSSGDPKLRFSSKVQRASQKAHAVAEAMASDAGRSVDIGGAMGFGMSLIVYGLVPEIVKNGLENVSTREYWDASLRQSWDSAVRGAFYAGRDNLIQDYVSAVLWGTNYSKLNEWGKTSFFRKAGFTGTNLAAMTISGVLDDAIIWAESPISEDLKKLVPGAEKNKDLMSSDNPYIREYYYKMMTWKMIQGSASNAMFEAPQLIMTLFKIPAGVWSQRAQYVARTALGVGVNMATRQFFEWAILSTINDEYLGVGGKAARYAAGELQYEDGLTAMHSLARYIFSNPGLIENVSNASQFLSQPIQAHLLSGAAAQTAGRVLSGNISSWALTGARKQVADRMIEETARRLAVKKLGEQGAALSSEEVMKQFGQKATQRVGARVIMAQAASMYYAGKWGFEMGREAEDAPLSYAADLGIAGAGGAAIGVGTGILTFGFTKAALGFGPPGMLVAGAGFITGVAVQITDENKKQFEGIENVQRRERFQNLRHGLTLAERGWINGMSLDNEGFSLEEIRQFYPGLPEDGVRAYHALSKAGFAHPLGNSIPVIEKALILHHQTGWRDLGRDLQRIEDASKGVLSDIATGNSSYISEEDFLDSALPNWRYLLSSESGERENFESWLPTLYGCRTVKNYIEKLDSGEVIPRNMAGLYADTVINHGSVHPSEFWEKCGLSPDATPEEVEMESFAAVEAEEEFFEAFLSEEEYDMRASSIVNGDGQRASELANKARGNYLSLDNLSKPFDQDPKVLRALNLPIVLSAGDLRNYPGLWDQIRPVLDSGGVLRTICYEAGMSNYSDLENSKMFEPVVSEALRRVLADSGKIVEGRIILDSEILAIINDCYRKLPPSPNSDVSLSDMASGPDIRVPLANVRDFPELYDQIVSVLKRTSALRWALKDCGLAENVDMSTLSDQKLNEVLTLALGNLLVANKMSVGRADTGIRASLSYAFGFSNPRYILPEITAEIAAVLADPKYNYFDTRSVRVAPMITP